MRVTVAASQSIGGRENQEDSAVVLTRHAVLRFSAQGTFDKSPDSDILAILCDGMGGHDLGEVASSTATEAAERIWGKLNASEIKAPTLLAEACTEANKAISLVIKDVPQAKGMGTTFVGVRLKQRQLSWTSVGDSHIFRFRRGQLLKLNQDHSMKPVLMAMARQGIIDADELATHPERNALRSAMMGEKLDLVDRSQFNLTLRWGDMVLIASDGIDVLSVSRVTEVLNAAWYGGASKAVRKLVAEAVEIGGAHQDNTTAILLRIW